MQLAKNLWLTREKTLGRKVQEFFLSQALESCYSKDEIMELYLNVVEFGPNQYGVGNGSMYWFHKGPGELVPTEAFWLASILPRPSRTQPPTDSSLKRVEGLMKRLAEDGRIPNFMDDVVEPEEVQTPEEP
jgi:membrane peptidoglycan carboxypeptidase